ncbi:MAG: hypothetical protein AAGD04_07350 [Pseudomonadota bacterium]
MSSFKTILAALLCFVMSAQAIFALPQSPSERVQVFATCAGRYSALAEHQRFFDGEASERAEAKKEDFERLIEAILPVALDWGTPGAQIISWRITAKFAQAELLHRGSFHSDAFMAKRSKEIAIKFLADCDGLALGT